MSENKEKYTTPLTKVIIMFYLEQHQLLKQVK